MGFHIYSTPHDKDVEDVIDKSIKKQSIERLYDIYEDISSNSRRVTFDKLIDSSIFKFELFKIKEDVNNKDYKIKRVIKTKLTKKLVDPIKEYTEIKIMENVYKDLENCALKIHIKPNEFHPYYEQYHYDNKGRPRCRGITKGGVCICKRVDINEKYLCGLHVDQKINLHPVMDMTFIKLNTKADKTNKPISLGGLIM